MLNRTPYTRFIEAAEAVNLDREFVSTFKHSSLKNVSTALTTHSGPEPMYTGSSSFSRLVGSLWHNISLIN